MSRIILTRYDDGQERLVVGWDHPAGGAFWQEFNQEKNPVTGKPYWETDEHWIEVTRHGGMWPGLPLNKLRDDMPDDLRRFVTDEIMELLEQHRRDPDSGYRTAEIDKSKN
jgi:hypothetical protein